MDTKLDLNSSRATDLSALYILFALKNKRTKKKNQQDGELAQYLITLNIYTFY